MSAKTIIVVFLFFFPLRFPPFLFLSFGSSKLALLCFWGPPLRCGVVNGESGLCVHAGPRCWADAGLGIGEGLDMENGKLLASGFWLWLWLQLQEKVAGGMLG